MSRVSTAAMRKALSLGVAMGGAVGLYYYLSGVPLPWRAALSFFLFVATYVMLEGFMSRD